MALTNDPPSDDTDNVLPLTIKPGWTAVNHFVLNDPHTSQWIFRVDPTGMITLNPDIPQDELVHRFFAACNIDTATRTDQARIWLVKERDTLRDRLVDMEDEIIVAREALAEFNSESLAVMAQRAAEMITELRRYQPIN